MSTKKIKFADHEERCKLELKSLYNRYNHCFKNLFSSFMTSSSVMCAIREARVELIKLIQQEFSISTDNAEIIFVEKIKPHLDQLRENIYLLIEYPYADRMYRDTYYAYHAKKLNPYKRDCIRISFFVSNVTHDEFRDINNTSSIQDRYLGFMILRPTIPYVIGRNVISPTALRRHDFISISAKFETTINGLKLFVYGFPHVSQDGESMTCAESAIWCLLEYLCWSSTIYRRVMPSEILQQVQKKQEERVLPSIGLDHLTMSHVLKGCGVGSIIYYSYDKEESRRLLSCYISSGLPIIINLANDKHKHLAHATVAVGHSVTTNQQIDQLKAATEKDTHLRYLLDKRQIRIFDNDDIIRNIVFVDDNFPVYQFGNYHHPVKYTRNPLWHDHYIDCFIAPLHTDVHMDAPVAKTHIKEVLLKTALAVPDNTEHYIRTFLVSSQLYKEYVLKNTGMTAEVKDELLNLMMGTFIWIGEISTKQLIKEKKAHGLIILDASEPNTALNNAIIFAAYGDAYHIPAINGELVEVSIPIGYFKIFINNLNKF